MPLWWISLRAISSTTEFNLLQPPPPHPTPSTPIWRHSRWVEVCDLLRQFCAWLPWPVLVWHLLLLVELYPDLHTGLVYSCLAGKCKHALTRLTHSHTRIHTYTHTTHLQSLGKSKKFSLEWGFGATVCVTALPRYSRQLAGRQKGIMHCWTKCQTRLQRLVLSRSQIWFR